MLVEQRKKKKALASVLNYIDYLQEKKYASGKKGTAVLYKSTHNQLELFLGKKKLTMKQIDARLVNDFVTHLQSLNLSHNSVSNYASIFRSVYNSAISEHLVSPKENPFQKLHLRPVPSYKRSIGTNVIKDMIQLDLAVIHFIPQNHLLRINLGNGGRNINKSGSGSAELMRTDFFKSVGKIKIPYAGSRKSRVSEFFKSL